MIMRFFMHRVKKNIVADVVSRIQPMESIFMALSTCHPLLLQQLQQFYTSHVAGLALMPKFCTPANVKEPFLFKWASSIT